VADLSMERRATLEAEVLRLRAKVEDLERDVERGWHLHHKWECPKCRRFRTQSTNNDYKPGKFGVYEADCGCEDEAENERLREALEKYGRHGKECPAGVEWRMGRQGDTDEDAPCDCGLNAALREGSDD